MDSRNKELVCALKEFVLDSSWQCVGDTSDFDGRRCTLLYTSQEDSSFLLDNIALFVDKEGRYFAIDSSCPHEGGPLHQGDIEDIGGSPTVFCPWHNYDFNLVTGKSSTGLETHPYETKVADGKLYIKVDRKLARERPVCAEKEKYVENTTHVIEEVVGIEDKRCDTLSSWACRILTAAKPREKVRLTEEAYNLWIDGDLSEIGYSIPPTQPTRTENLQVVAPGKIKRGKGGTLGSRIAILHSLANIEQWAIDLAWDIIARFSDIEINGNSLPKEFFDDFVQVAADEAKHFRLLDKRLRFFGSSFGSLPVHNGLWQSAKETSHDLLSRLAIVHMVHEARGLDVHPTTSARFEAQGDKESVSLIEIIYKDEITHVAAGIKWFLYICKNQEPSLDPIDTFHTIVKKHFRGYLKPPFDTEGRKVAGMTPEWYEPLMKPDTNKES